MATSCETEVLTLSSDSESESIRKETEITPVDCEDDNDDELFELKCFGSSKTPVKRLPIHAMSDSEDSDDAVICLNIPTKNSSSSLSHELSFSQSTQNQDDMNIDELGDNFIFEKAAPDTVANGDGDIISTDTMSTIKCSESQTSKLKLKSSHAMIRKKMTPTKNEKAEERLRERERKKQEKEFAKIVRQLDKEAKRCAKPDECLKSMKISIDNKLAEIPQSDVLFNALLDHKLSFSLEQNHISWSIVWYRHVSDVTVVENEVQRQERDELENVLLLYIPCPMFVDLIHTSIQKRKGKIVGQESLLDYVANIKTVFPKMDITIVTVGVNNYLKGKRGNLKRDNEDSELRKTNCKSVSKKDVDEAIIEVQLQLFLNYKPVDGDCKEFGALLARYTKAIAEAPFKKEKLLQQQQQFSWYAQADSSCPVKIGKDGSECLALWQQQIQQFNGIGKDIAQAIAATYTSPVLLVEAYSKCDSDKEAEKLLQDIVVRRDYGPLGTTRRVGPELSYKMFRFFTSINGNELLQR